MKKTIILCCFFALLVGCNQAKKAETQVPVVKNELRAPAYPLVTIDPYTSAWSFSDKLYDESVKHWTGENIPLIGAIRVDGKIYRFMGTESIPMVPIIKMAEKESWKGRYVLNKPANGWEKPEFNDQSWKEGQASFGTKEETGVKTLWEGENTNIWVRREIQLENDLDSKKIFLEYSHDDDIEIYINGVEVVNTGYKWKKNVILPLPEAALKTLKKGKNVISAHCLNRTGGALVDFGLCEEAPVKQSLETTAVQNSVEVQPTQTYYSFTCGPINLNLTFMAPLLMDDLKLLSRPVNYITYDVKSTDGKDHTVEVYFEAAPNWALDKADQESQSTIVEKEGLMFLQASSKTQNILGKKGDNVRIDWGHFYLCGSKENSSYAVGNGFEMRNSFGQNGVIKDITAQANEPNNLALTHSLGKVNNSVTGKILIGYDDIYSIQYFEENLRPYWNEAGDKNIFSEFKKADSEYAVLKEACNKFDDEMMTKAVEAGGKEYASLCALAYRQAISAHKLVKASNGDLLFLSKENFSNGSIGTVDITYPSAPLFLLYNPELVKGLLNHIFYYSESGKWTKPFAAHDIGTYPLGNGQTYGGDMPVEESGNMLITTAALATVEGNAKYAEKHWDVLTVWTDYLVEKGLDPENQLCTDDFAGHFAHNTNLSIKAILGIASYGRLAEMLGKKDIAQKYTDQAKAMAEKWVTMANDGDHYRLTFDKPGTWSQKYNLVWDKLLKLNIFPETIAQKEIPYYLTKQNKYGLPLDNREAYTKADWIMWTATLAPDKATFEQFVTPVYKFMNESTSRVPMTDWYWTDKPEQRGFQARSVVGGYFIKMLEPKIMK